MANPENSVSVEDVRPISRTATEYKAPKPYEQGERIAKNINELHKEQLTFGQRMADKLANVAGSWRNS